MWNKIKSTVDMLVSARTGKLCLLCLKATTCAMSRRAGSPWLCAVLPIQAGGTDPGESLPGAVPSLRKAFASPAGARLQLCWHELLPGDTDNWGDKWPLEGCPVAKVSRPLKKLHLPFLALDFLMLEWSLTWIVPSIAGDRWWCKMLPSDQRYLRVPMD